MPKLEKTLDVLILHGLSQDIVEDLKSLFESLGLRTGFVLDLPSDRKNQKEKVLTYIKSTHLAIVLVSVDDSNPQSNQARPNVYNELTDCHRILKRNVLVLVETRKGKPVELPSNLKGHLAEIYFQRKHLHKVYPQLIKELRLLKSINGETPLKPLGKRNEYLLDFMQKMKALWEDEFDRAWECIFRCDYDAEVDLTILLDKFFDEIWQVLYAFADGAPPEKIVPLVDAHHKNALGLTAQAWDIAARIVMHKADEKNKSYGHSPVYEKANAALREAKHAKTDTKKIEAFKVAIKIMKQFVKGKKRA